MYCALSESECNWSRELIVVLYNFCTEITKPNSSTATILNNPVTPPAAGLLTFATCRRRHLPFPPYFLKSRRSRRRRCGRFTFWTLRNRRRRPSQIWKQICQDIIWSFRHIFKAYVKLIIDFFNCWGSLDNACYQTGFQRRLSTHFRGPFQFFAGIRLVLS